MVTVQAAIEVRAIGQRARSSEEVTLRDVSLTVGHGELMAIIGGSGSGKTTLLDAMSGLRPPSSGTVSRSTGWSSRAGRYVGYIPNADTIHPVLSLDRALTYTAALRGAGDANGAAAGVLRVVDLAGLAAARVGDLDAGQRKRAAIAVELLAEPSQLFLEEPTIGLDPAQGTEVMRRLRRLCESGVTVVLTTQNPLDAARCDKVAVLATGGHLAFFGTPDAACDYFAADSLDEIYERLAGLGDPAAAWSRRFPQFSRTIPGFSPSPTIPPQPGPARLVPDMAGPHSAGRASTGPRIGLLDDGLLDDGLLDEGLADEGLADDGLSEADLDADPGGELGGAELDGAEPARAGAAGSPAGGTAARVIRPFRQWSVLTRRNVDVLVRSRPMLAALAGAPVAVLLAFLVLLGLGAFDPARPGASFWAVFGGFFVGLAYGLPQIRPELGTLRAERFCGLSAGAYVLAKSAVLVPLLAVADAVILLVPGLAGRLQGGGYGPVFVTLLLSSAVALGLGLLLSAVAPARPGALTPVAASCLPPVLLAAAVLALLHRPVWGNWLTLGVCLVALLAATTAIIYRRLPSTDRAWRRG
jgi:ABC transport system ATP-binding/permease protein